MKLTSLRTSDGGAAPDARGLAPFTPSATFLTRFAHASSRVRSFAAFVAASRWAMPLGRAALVAAGLVVLASIGGSALARGPAPVGTLPAAERTDRHDDPATPPATDAARAPADAGTLPSPDDRTGERDSPPREPSARGRATPDAPVVLNVATIDELQRLPSIGAKRAKAIFDLRARIGRFRHIEDLLRVKGIGRATLKKLRPLVRLDAPSPAVPPPADAGTLSN